MSYVLMWMGGGRSLRGFTIKKRTAGNKCRLGRELGPLWNEPPYWLSSTVVNLETIETATKMNSTCCKYVYMYTHIDVHVRACVCI